MSGFTLLELMVVVVIGAILLGIGIPSFNNFIRNGRMTAAANDLVVGLHYARSEAIKRRAAVSICATDDPLANAPVCTAATVPPDPDDPVPVPSVAGWVVFVDSNGDGRFGNPSFVDLDADGVQDLAIEDLNGDGIQDIATEPDLNGDGNFDLQIEPTLASEEVLRRGQRLPGSIQARSTLDPFTVTYLDTGLPSSGAVTVVMCDERGNVPSAGELSAARAVTVSATGRPAVSREKAEIQALGGCA